MPLIDFYQLSKRLHWSWEDYRKTPERVRQLCLLYAQMEEAAHELD